MTTTDLRPPEHDDTGPQPGGPPRGLIVGGIVVVGLLALLGLAWLLGSLVGDSGGDGSDITPGLPVSIVIPDGASARSIGSLLAEEDVVASPSAFERAVRDRGLAERLRAGSYDLETGMDLDELLTALTTGPAPIESFSVRVIEGLRIEEMLASLADQTDFTLVEFEVALQEIESSLHDGSATLVSWEGLLAPDTYEFTVDDTPASILQEMAATLERRVNRLDWEAVGLTPYEGIIVASLIEKEAKLDEERSLISSVIHNRLDEGMLLQIDATVIYALGENPGRVLFSDLEIDSPYNTYRYEGLPPTPISGVRTASLEGAAAPDDTDFLYYVLIDPSGRHGFAATYEEFLRYRDEGRASGALP